MITNLVLSACGPNLVTMMGVLHRLQKKQYFDLKNIEAFYGSSGGTILAVLMLLSDDFNMIKQYFIKRPWHTVWQLDPTQFFNIYDNMGLFDIDDFYKGIEPFFLAKNISRNVTLSEFYEITQKTVHFYIVELNELKVLNVSHKTHPTMEVVEAMYKSSCVPGIFKPIIENDECYIDGGLMDYCPVDEALVDTDNDSILGLCNHRYVKHNNITKESNIIDFFITLLFKNMDYVIDTIFKAEKLNNIIYVPGFISNKLWIEMLTSEEKRNEMYNLGTATANKFLASIKEPSNNKTCEN